MSTLVEDIAHFLGLAAAARQRGDRVVEAQMIAKVLAIEPEQPQALNACGMQALADGRADDAMSYFRRAAAADPQEPALWMNLATACRLLDHADDELEALDRVLAIDRRHFMALLRTAEAQQRRGEWVRAVQHWQSVLTLSAGMDDMPAALVATLIDARKFVTEQTRTFGTSVDEALSADRKRLSPRDRRRFDACVDHALGRRGIYSSECAGVHFPFLPADEFFDRENFPWLASIESKTDAIRAELLALLRQNVELRPYVEQKSGTPNNKWTALDGSLDWGTYFLWEYGQRLDDACARCPETIAALDAIPQAILPGRAPTAFFSLLNPKTRIPPHTGVTNTRAIIHLPLIIPPGCGFRVGGETREWRVGEALAFDDTIEHEAWNDSDEVRAVLIFDVWNPHLTDEECRLMQRFFQIADAKDPDAMKSSITGQRRI